jgi:hypothetical protein
MSNKYYVLVERSRGAERVPKDRKAGRSGEALAGFLLFRRLKRAVPFGRLYRTVPLYLVSAHNVYIQYSINQHNTRFLPPKGLPSLAYQNDVSDPVKSRRRRIFGCPSRLTHILSNFSSNHFLHRERQ